VKIGHCVQGQKVNIKLGSLISVPLACKEGEYYQQRLFSPLLLPI